MGVKIRVWACNECEIGTCFSANDKNRDQPAVCEETEQLWKITYKYEINKIVGEEIKPSRWDPKNDYPELPRAVFNPPNCLICQWIKADFGDSEIIGPGSLIAMNNGCPTNYNCMAQGGKDAHNCYNTPECQALFKPVE